MLDEPELREEAVAALMTRWGVDDGDEDAYDAANRDLDVVLPIIAAPQELAQRRLTAISRYIDASDGYVGVPAEAHMWRRVNKITAENGEVHDAISGMLGENPRKGVTHTQIEVIMELLDVALCALGVVEYMTDNQGEALGLLDEKIAFVAERAGIELP